MPHEQIEQQTSDEEEDEEQWETLKVDEDYEICREYPYQIKKTSTGRILKETLATDGYVTVKLNRKTYYKHRLVAVQFIPNPDNLPFVNHKNHVRNDNRIENLEWVNRSQNQNDLSRTNNGREVDYVDELPDNAIIVNHYNNCTFINYYYDDDRFFKQIHNGKYRVIPWCRSGRNGMREGVSLTDVDNVPRHVSKRKFKKLYNID